MLIIKKKGIYMDRLRKRSRMEQGFTLIEIMIVITLLALVGTFAVNNFTSRLQEGNRKGTKVIMQQLRTALEDYMRTCSSYPSNAQGGLDALVTAPADGSCKDYDPNGYVQNKKLPKDAWGSDFIYISEDGKSYVLKSLGGDKKEGGTGTKDKDLSTDDPDF